MIMIPRTLTPTQQAAEPVTPVAARARGAATPFLDELSQATAEIGRSTASDASAAASSATSPVAATTGPRLSDIFCGGPSASSSTPDPAPTSDPTPDPTPQSVFGSHPYLDNPVETMADGSQRQLNPIWFATPETAARVASMLGGTVVESNEFTSACSPVQQAQPNQMVKLPNGTLIFPGQVAWVYSLGYDQSYLEGFMQQMAGGGETA